MEERLKELERLKNGDFTNASVNDWFIFTNSKELKDNYFDYVFAALEGLDKNINYDLLNFLAIYANHYLNSKDISENINLELSQILERIIIIGFKHPEYYSIVQKFYNHPDEMVRLYCAANGNYVSFLNDVSNRVRKVALIRAEFINNYHYASDLERERVNFLTTALKVKAITTEYEYFNEVEFEDTPFYSVLFNGVITASNFDKDILYRITDKRILASKIEELIMENSHLLNWDMFPKCFDELKGITKGRK